MTCPFPHCSPGESGATIAICRVCHRQFPVAANDPGLICSDLCSDLEELFEAWEEAVRADDRNDSRDVE